MIKLICPNCERRRKFLITDQEKYKCEACNATFKQCKSENCLNLIKQGIVCKKCVGKGMKNGGVAVATGLLVIGSAAFKYLKKVK